MKLRIKLYLLYLFFAVLYGKTWPMEYKTGLTSSFGEWREGHLHAGIDIPTGNKFRDVFSVCDGWIMRLRTSPWGYGKAVYIRDSLGNTYVYAHLSSFCDKIDTIVRKEQLHNLSYRVDKWFEENDLKVDEGEIIAKSGRSGCMWPHLHFELRDRMNRPVDPCVRGFEVADSIPPVIKSIYFVPMNDSSTVFGSHLGAIVDNENGFIRLNFKGKIGIEIECSDRVNGHSGNLAPGRSEIFVNDSLIRGEYIDRFSYTNSKDSRFLYNYQLRFLSGRKFRRLYSIKGNRYNFYRGGDGFLTPQPGDTIIICVRDGSGNKSSVKIPVNLGHVKTEESVLFFHDLLPETITVHPDGVAIRKKEKTSWLKAGKIRKIARSGDSLLIWNIGNHDFPVFESPDARCYIRNLCKEEINSNLLSVKSSRVHPNRWMWEPVVPLLDRAVLEIVENEPGTSVYEFTPDGPRFCSSKRIGGKLVADIEHLGTYGVLIDTISPFIETENAHFSDTEMLTLNAKDSLSGIDFNSVQTYIDGRRTVFRYDPQMKRLVFEYPEEITEGEHELRVRLSDRQGNVIDKTWKIYKD